MAPKFKGGSDDWLDSPEGRGRGGGRKKKSRQPKERLFVDDPNGVVVEVFPSLARVLTDDGKDLLCAYKRSALIHASELRERSPVVVGDRVRVSATDSKSGIIEGLGRRITRLVRPAPGRD